MSPRLDSPLARQDPRLNVADQYVFAAEDATVLVMNVRTSLVGDAPARGFHEQARHEFKIHLDDDRVENLAFRIVFQPEAQSRQAYQVFRLEGGDAAEDAAGGSQVAFGHTGETVRGAHGLTVWAGRVLDPFFLDLGQLGVIEALVQHGHDVDVAGSRTGPATNTFAGGTVNSIVLRVPHRDRMLFPQRRIRLWSSIRLATDTGGWRQIERSGLPMIWSIFRDPDHATSPTGETHPVDDVVRHTAALHNLIAATVRQLGTCAQPDAYARSLTRRLLPDTLPYRVGTPAIFGFIEFNGRALGDNAPEVVFSLVTNAAVSTGLSSSLSSGTRSSSFPYVVPAGFRSLWAMASDDRCRSYVR